MPQKLHYTVLIEQAKDAEEGGDISAAINLYEKAIKQSPLVELPYYRLMILYKKEKKYTEELRVINRGLDIFRSYFDEKTKPFTAAGKLGQISKALLKSVTGTGKKHLLSSYPEPIPSWTVRKKTVEKKIK